MIDGINGPFCCGIRSKWVENVAGKGYNFCSECRKEVEDPALMKEELIALNEPVDEMQPFIYFSKLMDPPEAYPSHAKGYPAPDSVLMRQYDMAFKEDAFDLLSGDAVNKIEQMIRKLDEK